MGDPVAEPIEEPVGQGERPGTEPTGARDGQPKPGSQANHDSAAGDEQPGDENRGRLPSFEDVNLSVGQFMAGLEQKILHNRPPAVVVVEQEGRGESVATSGVVIDDLPTEPLDRPEPPDTSGAKL